jgi:hypothetical protein
MTGETKVRAGRLGGLSRAARHDPREIGRRAHETWRASFLQGHECGLCERIDIPADAPPQERARRGEALFRLHMQRVRDARSGEQSPERARLLQEAMSPTSTRLDGGGRSPDELIAWMGSGSAK